MTLSTTGYTVGSNRPLTHARILWQSITSMGGAATDPLPLNDYTFQRFQTLGSASFSYTLLDSQLDTVFIAAHNLGTIGATVSLATRSSAGTLTTRATVSPTDDSPIAFMINDNGVPYVGLGFRITITATLPASIGIIRAGVALQMEQPLYGGVRPIDLNRLVETRHAMSETGQWLGRTLQWQAQASEMNWQHLTADWYRANFDPFARSLPQTPFGLIQNPARMPDAVAWCWTDASPQPENMGVRDYMQVSLPITGYAG